MDKKVIIYIISNILLAKIIFDQLYLPVGRTLDYAGYLLQMNPKIKIK